MPLHKDWWKSAKACYRFAPATASADVAKLVDARDLKSLDFGHAGSSPAVRTTPSRNPLAGSFPMSIERLYLWSWEKTFRQWAGPGFTRVYIALHPFMQVPGLKANADGYLDLCKVPKTHPAFDMAKAGSTGPDGVASNHDSVLKRFARPRPWGWAVQAAGLHDTAHVERAIDSYLGRAKDEFRDAGAAKKLHALVQKHDLLLPTEDYLSPMIEATVGRMYRALGVEHVEIGNQMDDAAAVVPVDDFLSPDQALIELDVPARAAYSHDETMQMLTISDWCAHYTIICLSERAAAIVDPSQQLEGFWADDNTSADWPYADILAKRKQQPARSKPARQKSGQPIRHKPRSGADRKDHANRGKPGNRKP
jgi:hypothetical protein